MHISLAPGSAELDAPRLGADYVIKVPVQPGINTLELRAQQPGARVQVASLALEP